MKTKHEKDDEKDRRAQAYRLCQAAAKIKATKLNLPASRATNPYAILTREEIEEVTKHLNLLR